MDVRIKKAGTLTLVILLEFIAMFGIIKFQNSIFVSLSLPVRAVLIVVMQWLLLIVPIIFMKQYKISLSDIGFSKSKIGVQVITGLTIGIAMSLVFTVLPILTGYKDMIGSTSYTHVWQFCHQFVYMIFGVALVEEVFYRGFLFERLINLSYSKWLAIIVSSVIFGLSHIFVGNIIQVVATTLLGIFFCICRDKVKNCTTLSLIIAHGMHNALITLFVAILS